MVGTRDWCSSQHCGIWKVWGRDAVSAAQCMWPVDVLAACRVVKAGGVLLQRRIGLLVLTWVQERGITVAAWCLRPADIVAAHGDVAAWR